MFRIAMISFIQNRFRVEQNDGGGGGGGRGSVEMEFVKTANLVSEEIHQKSEEVPALQHHGIIHIIQP